MQSISGVESVRKKVVNTVAWHGNFAIIADKYFVEIILDTNSICCINFQNVTWDFIFLNARLSYLVKNNMQA
jgi:hypothetical protein